MPEQTNKVSGACKTEIIYSDSADLCALFILARQIPIAYDHLHCMMSSKRCANALAKCSCIRAGKSNLVALISHVTKVNYLSATNGQITNYFAA